VWWFTIESLFSRAFSKALLGIVGLSSFFEDLREAWSSYPYKEIIRRARKGVDAVYPQGRFWPALMAVKGAAVVEQPRRFATLDDILLLPPAFTPLRLKKMSEILREPNYTDVDLGTEFGGFRASMPLMVASMGSVQVANSVSLEIAKAAGRLGVPMGVGENVATMWGYSKRIRSNQPCFKERVMTYLEATEGGVGGIVIQQSVEDAYNELWNLVYSDPDVEPYIEKGAVGFEVKIGQGAKPGLGGEAMVPLKEAERLRDKYHIPEVSEMEGGGYVTRHSAPGTYTPDILRGMVRMMRNNYPRCRLWIKLGPFRDLPQVLRILLEERVDAVWIDGKEGGTGMSPLASMKHLGLPLLAALCSIVEFLANRESGTSLLAAGRLYDGGHLVKCLCLGLDGMVVGRPMVISAWAAGARGVENYVRTVEVEAKMLISALGKYSVKELGPEDLGCLDQELAERLRIRYVYG